MTSKFSIDNRELLQRISSGEAVAGIDFGNLIVRELAAFRLSAMDSEPYGFTDGHRRGMIYEPQYADRLTEPVPVYRHAQPAPVSYSDFEEFWSAYIHPLAQDDELKDFSWGIWNACVSNSQPSPVVEREPIAWLNDAYLARGVIDGEAGSEDAGPGYIPVYREAGPQPSPVVPDDVLDALQKVAHIRLDLNEFDGDRRGIADCLGDAEEALIEVVNRRAAMLNGGKP